MFGAKPRGTVIAKGLKIVGSVTAEGLVEVNGQIDGVARPAAPCASLLCTHILGDASFFRLRNRAWSRHYRRSEKEIRYDRELGCRREKIRA